MVDRQGDSWAVSLLTPDRWLSESIEGDMLEGRDTAEDLIDDELVELNFPGKAQQVKHFRDDAKMYVFRSCAPFPVASAESVHVLGSKAQPPCRRRRMTTAAPKVLMLGWEFPPFITGGLGTACHGLTKALDELGAQVTFMLPKAVSGEVASHADAGSGLVAPAGRLDAAVDAVMSKDEPTLPGAAAAADPASADRPAASDTAAPASAAGLGTAALPAGLAGVAAAAGHAGVYRHLRMLTAPLTVRSVYAAWEQRQAGHAGASHSAAPSRLLRAAGLDLELDPDASFTDDPEMVAALEAWEAFGQQDPAAAAEYVEMLRAIRAAIPEAHGRGATASLGQGTHGPDYAGDLVAQSEAYARFCVEACRELDFDVIHAHDWLTYPAGIALARVTWWPSACAAELDRSGAHVNQPVYNIEQQYSATGGHRVSMLTRNICHNRYGIPLNKCDVVYNGVDLEPRSVGLKTIQKREKVVLYFGRITMQKGPEYFVQAARRVLDVMDNVKFVVAGSGDQAQRMIEMAAGMDMGHKMLFTGFLRGKDIQRVFQIADVYVMPSVSEPFGIAPLEALGHRVPVLISRQSGVSEVLQNALKFDFWDTEDLANKIVAVLRHPPLQRTLREEGFDEVRSITWEGAARKMVSVYRKAAEAVHRRPPILA